MSCILEWEGGKAYVGCSGMVEGVDGDMWALGRPLWVLKRRLNNNNVPFTITEGDFSLVEAPRKRGRPRKDEEPSYSVRDAEGYYPGQFKIDPMKMEEDSPDGECVK